MVCSHTDEPLPNECCRHLPRFPRRSERRAAFTPKSGDRALPVSQAAHGTRSEWRGCAGKASGLWELARCRRASAVYERDARLRSLIVALREIGDRNTEENRGALAAAEAIERALHVARRQTPRNADPRGGRSLIERLQTDPLATL